MAKLEKHWNIDDLEVGQMYVVEHGSPWSHRWDEDTEDFYHEYERIDKGTILLLVEMDIEISWEETNFLFLRDVWGSPTSNRKSDTFHSFIIGDKTLLLDRKALYCLEPWEYSKTVQSCSGA